MKYYSKFIYLIILSISIISCATIPPDAPELSAELGKRISAIEDANLTLLQKYFDFKREKIDKFIMEEWVPIFAEEFFSKPKIKNLWETIVKENNKEDRLKFIITLGPQIQGMINRKRMKLIKPIDELEREIEKIIRNEYENARAINNTITSLLYSTSKVTENRKRYLDMIGVKDDKISSVINETDDAVSNVLEKAKDAQEKVEKVEKFIEKIKEIRDKIRKKE